MPEDLKLSQIGSSQLPPPFRGLHSPGVRKHCQIIFACYFWKSSITSLKYMPKWKKVLNVSSLMWNKYARSELIQYKICAIRTKYYLLFDLSNISETLKFGHSHQNWYESAKTVMDGPERWKLMLHRFVYMIFFFFYTCQKSFDYIGLLIWFFFLYTCQKSFDHTSKITGKMKKKTYCALFTPAR